MMGVLDIQIGFEGIVIFYFSWKLHFPLPVFSSLLIYLNAFCEYLSFSLCKIVLAILCLQFRSFTWFIHM